MINSAVLDIFLIEFLQVLNIQGKGLFGKRMAKKRCFCHLCPNIKGSDPSKEPIAISFVSTDQCPLYDLSIELIFNLLLVTVLMQFYAWKN